MWNIVYTILIISSTPALVFGSYPCLCSYQPETSVFESRSSSSIVLGHLFEFDCKPTYPLDGSLNSDFFTIQFGGQVGYIINTPGVLSIESCPGTVISTDEVHKATTFMSESSPKLTRTPTPTTTPTSTPKSTTTESTTPTPKTTSTTTPIPTTKSTQTLNPTTHTITPNPTTTVTTTPEPTTTSTTTPNPTNTYTTSPNPTITTTTLPTPTTTSSTTQQPTITSTTTRKPTIIHKTTQRPTITSTTSQQPTTASATTPNPTITFTTTQQSTTRSTQQPTTTSSTTLYPTTTITSTPKPTTTITTTPNPTTTSTPIVKPTTSSTTTQKPTPLSTTREAKEIPTCRNGWFLYGSSCYAFHLNKQLNRSAARTDCQNVGSQLVNINSRDEQNMIEDHLRAHDNYQHIIHNSDGGLHDTAISTGGTCRQEHCIWQDQSTGANTNIDYMNWNHHFPKHDEDFEVCVALIGRKNYTWLDFRCFDEFYYICEKHVTLQPPVSSQVFTGSSSVSIVTSSTATTSTDTHSSAAPCPDGWVLYGLSCYEFHLHHRYSHTSAIKNCHDDDSHLVNINSRGEQSMIADHLSSEVNYHIKTKVESLTIGEYLLIHHSDYKQGIPLGLITSSIFAAYDTSK